MYGAIDTATAEKAPIRGIDDGVNAKTRNVPNLYANHSESGSIIIRLPRS